MNKNTLKDHCAEFLTSCEHFLSKYGCEDPRGIGWTDYEAIEGRLESVLQPTLPFLGKGKISLLDIGCGTANLLRHIKKNNYAPNIAYTGIDISETITAAAQKNFPEYNIFCRDILETPYPNESFDFVILNGTLFGIGTRTQEQMIEDSLSLLRASFKMAKLAVVFNCYGEFVDYEDKTQFYWHSDEVIETIRTNFSKYFSMYCSYKAHDITYTIYKDDLSNLIESFTEPQA